MDVRIDLAGGAVAVRRIRHRGGARVRRRGHRSGRRRRPGRRMTDEPLADPRARGDPGPGGARCSRSGSSRIATDLAARGGQADHAGTPGGAAGGVDAAVLRRRGADLRGRAGPDGRRRGRGRTTWASSLRVPDRCGGCDHAVQLPAEPGRPQGRSGDRRRLRGGGQARQPDTAVGAQPGAGAVRRRTADGRTSAWCPAAVP